MLSPILALGDGECKRSPQTATPLRSQHIRRIGRRKHRSPSLQYVVPMRRADSRNASGHEVPNRADLLLARNPGVLTDTAAVLARCPGVLAQSSGVLAQSSGVLSRASGALVGVLAALAGFRGGSAVI